MRYKIRATLVGDGICRIVGWRATQLEAQQFADMIAEIGNWRDPEVVDLGPAPEPVTGTRPKESS